MRDVSVGLVRTVFPPAKGIRLVGVTLSNFNARDSDRDGEPVEAEQDLLDII